MSNRRLPPSRKYEEEDYMKKLIAIAVVFALVSGVAFAVDLGGTVIGQVTVLQNGDYKNDDGDDTIVGSANFKRIRIEGAGEAGDGKFGGWIRIDPKGDGEFVPGGAGSVWWKPIDQFKVTIGGNPDGVWGKEGVTGWMFGQMAYDSGVTLSDDNVWSGSGLFGQGLKTRNAFYRGFGDPGLLLEINPIDMIGINIALPFWKSATIKVPDDDKPGEFKDKTVPAELKDIFGGLVAQLDVKLDFGNIAITYEGEASYIQNGNVGWAGPDGGTIFGYFGGSFGDLSLDIGIGFELPNKDDGPAKDLKNPFAVGLGLKYVAGDFGVKLRAAASFPTEDKDGKEAQPLKILADLLPYYVINDSTRAFLGAGLGIASPKEGDAITGFYVNPYLEVGAEWGPCFYIGFKLWSDGTKDKDDKTTTNWAVPIGIIVSF